MDHRSKNLPREILRREGKAIELMAARRKRAQEVKRIIDKRGNGLLRWRGLKASKMRRIRKIIPLNLSPSLRHTVQQKPAYDTCQRMASSVVCGMG